MTYTKIWAINAARSRWNAIRLRKGQAPLPLIAIAPVMTERAIVMRERRELERRRREYDEAHGRSA
jgi:hypothetical protein